jgi:hypothetical protein
MVLILNPEMWKLPAEHVGFYAEQDARLTYLLWQRFKHEIVTQNLNYDMGIRI